jgi:hypothetical protein
MGVLLSPSTGTPPWLDIILMLLLTVVMWVALRPFRRLTQMVSSRTNHFATASGGVSTTARSAARTSTRILSSALGTFLGVSAAQRSGVNTATVEAQAADGVPQRVEADSSYLPVVTSPPVEATPATPGLAGAGSAPPAMAPAAQPAAMAPGMLVNTSSVTVVRGNAGAGQPAEGAGEIYAPAASANGSRVESGASRAGSTAAKVVSAVGGLAGPAGSPDRTADAATGGRYEFSGNSAGAVPRDPNRDYFGPVLPSGTGAEWNPATDGEPSRQPTDRGFARNEAAQNDDFDLDELNEVFRPNPAQQR